LVPSPDSSFMFKFLLLIITIWFSLDFLAYRSLHGQELQVYFLDVGQGDATLFITPSKQKILIDGGPGNSVLTKLGEILPFHDRQIDLLILTHPHADHLDGLLEVLKRYQVRILLLNPVYYSNGSYLELWQTLEKSSTQVWRAESKTDFELVDQIKLDVLFPYSVQLGLSYKNVNNASVIFKLTYGNTTFLLAGDAEREVEDLLLANNTELSANYFKLSHHGSRTANQLAFLRSINPRLVVISTGRDNKFGHPHAETSQTLAALNLPAWITSNTGSLHLSCNLETCETLDSGLF